jgi:hypothetical protein
MNSVLLVLALTTGQPMPKEVNLVVHPAELPRNLLRVQFLPPLLDQQPGDALALVAEARQALKDIADSRQLADEIREESGAKLPDVNRKRLKDNLEKIKKPLEILEKAARASQCDWGKITEALRTKGIGASLAPVQEWREVVPLFAARARLEVLEDRPEDAVKSLGLGLRLARRMGEGPTLINHLVAVALSAILFEQLDVIVAHPKCPNLYWALASLPHPFLSLRVAMEGERCSVYGTLPALFKFVRDPNGPLPTEEEMKYLVKVGEETFRNLGFKITEVDRIATGLAIQAKHESAIKYLTESGFPADRLRQWPPVLVAILHALVDYEEKLGRMQEAMDTPYWQAAPKILALEEEMRPRGLTTPPGPAIPLARLLLPAVSKVLQANGRCERRLAALTTVEALRLHARRTGAWPKTLAEIDGVAIPIDPVTGKPFEYSLEGDLAILHGPRLTGKESAQFELYYRLRLK